MQLKHNILICGAKKTKEGYLLRISLGKEFGLDDGETSNNALFDTALVGAPLDLEESLVSPVLVPAVGNEPVVKTSFSSPSEDLDGVASEGCAADVVVDTTLVGKEVVVDGEGSLNWAMGLDLALDLGDIVRETVNARGFVDVIGVGGAETRLAALDALGGGRVTAAVGVLSGDVVVTGWERVRLAPVGGVVQPATNQSGVLEIAPSSLGVASVAALSAAEAAASQQVLAGDPGLDLLSAGNADSVAHGFGSTEGPAGAAVGLISDFLDGLAVGPGSPGVEFVVDALERSDVLLGELSLLGGFENSHQALDFVHGLAIPIVVMASFPGSSLDGVNLFDDCLLVEQLDLREDHCDSQGSQNESPHNVGINIIYIS